MNLDKKTLEKIQLAVIVLYSLGIIASILPYFADLPNEPVILYYLFFPGYTVVLLFAEKSTVLTKLMFSLFVGMALILSLSSIRQLVAGGVPVPFNVIVPVLTILFAIVDYYRPSAFLGQI